MMKKSRKVVKKADGGMLPGMKDIPPVELPSLPPPRIITDIAPPSISEEYDAYKARRNDDLPDQAAVNALRARGRAMQAASQMRGGRRGMPSSPSRMAGMKKGGKVKARKMDGCAMKGKTRGRMR